MIRRTRAAASNAAACCDENFRDSTWRLEVRYLFPILQRQALRLTYRGRIGVFLPLSTGLLRCGDNVGMEISRLGSGWGNYSLPAKIR